MGLADSDPIRRPLSRWRRRSEARIRRAYSADIKAMSREVEGTSNFSMIFAR